MNNNSFILCVDDEHMILASLREELRNIFGSEYMIETAESGHELLEIAEDLQRQQHEIPLVIADYVMPNMKGDELLKYIHRILPETRTIMLTGQATTDGIAAALNSANLFRFIGKPWEPHDLALSVEEAIKSYRLNQQLKVRQRELEIANRKLRKLDASKNYFLSLLAHELYTPINGIQGLSAVIEAATEDPEIRECCSMIMDSAKRLHRFADTGLLITRLLNEKYQLRARDYDVGLLIEQAITSKTRLASEKNVRVISELLFTDLVLKIDPDLISKVLIDIVDNAIRFSPKDSTIRIHAAKVDENCCIKVSDEGSGFSDEALDNIFEYFISDHILNHSEGQGLALAAAKLIMDQHQGAIVIRNRPEGGAEVTMRIPINLGGQTN